MSSRDLPNNPTEAPVGNPDLRDFVPDNDVSPGDADSGQGPQRGRFASLRALRARFDDPKSSLWLIKRLFLENAGDYKREYALAIAAMSVVAICTALSAWIMRDVINEIFVERNSDVVWLIALIVLTIFLIKGIAGYAHAVILSRIGNNIIARNQKRVYAHLLDQSLEFHRTHSMSELVTRMSRNVQSARDVLNMLVMSFGRDLLSLVGLVVVMISLDPILSIIALLIMPPAIIGVGGLVRRVRKVAKHEIVSQAKIVGGTQEASLGIRVIKAFNLEDRMKQVIHGAIEDVEFRANRIAKINARTSPLMETLGGLAIAAVILYAGFSVLKMGRDPGSFFAFVVALLMAYEPAKRLARLNIQLEAALVGVRFVYDLLDTPRVQKDRPDARPIDISQGRISFENVAFSYGAEAGDLPVLHEVSFVAEPGTVTALVGPSGAGKTTILSLIERFYRPQSGRILVDGTDIAEVTAESLRDGIAFVTQDTFLFAGTVRQNILMGRPGATDTEVIQASKAANAHDFISAMAQGYETVLSEGDAGLSGGQKQRIAIARAVLREAPVLLLDEATSALDNESEALVRQALDRLMEGRTTIAIAHRLSTIRQAGKIYVMNEGRIVEAGPHAELVQRDGLYARLYALQFNEPAAAAE